MFLLLPKCLPQFPQNLKVTSTIGSFLVLSFNKHVQSKPPAKHKTDFLNSLVGYRMRCIVEQMINTTNTQPAVAANIPVHTILLLRHNTKYSLFYHPLLEWTWVSHVNLSHYGSVVVWHTYALDILHHCSSLQLRQTLLYTLCCVVQPRWWP